MKGILLVILGFCIFNVLCSQEDFPIDNTIGTNQILKVDKVFPTIIVYNIPTTTILRRGEMKLYLAHRMGMLGTGIDGSFGLYQANSRIGADIGLHKKLTIGLGTTSQQKIYDGNLKYQLTKQTSKFPFESAVYLSINFSNTKFNVPDEQQFLWQRITYYNQIMFSRLINKYISMQLLLSYIHKNMVLTKRDKNDIFAFGTILNIQLNRMYYFATEYMFMPQKFILSSNVQSHIISTGIQIHTGPRHVFQIFLSNSVGILPHTVLTETTSSFVPKNIRISFNIPTTFNLF